MEGLNWCVCEACGRVFLAENGNTLPERVLCKECREIRQEEEKGEKK